jgi:hypothetical protein
LVVVSHCYGKRLEMGIEKIDDTEIINKFKSIWSSKTTGSILLVNIRDEEISIIKTKFR